MEGHISFCMAQCVIMLELEGLCMEKGGYLRKRIYYLGEDTNEQRFVSSLVYKLKIRNTPRKRGLHLTTVKIN